MFDTLLPWLVKICVALVIAILLPKLFARSRGGAEPHAQRSVAATEGRSLGGGGSVLDDGWVNRKKNQTVGKSQQEQPQGPKNRREAAAAAASSRRNEGSVNQTYSNGEDDVTNITDEEQWEAILLCSKARPIVVKMTASWCAPCKRIDPSYVLLARKHAKDMKFYRIDVDELEDVSESLEVDLMPSFLLFKDGKEIQRVKGANVRELEDMVANHATNGHEKYAHADANTASHSVDETKEDKADTPAEPQQDIRPSMQSSANHPGMGEFQAWYVAISDLYRQYLTGSENNEVDAPIIPRSERGNVQIHLEVLNSTTAPVDVFWIDYLGREEWKGSAGPGGTWTQQTWIGHPWTFRAQGGQVLCFYVPFRVIPTTDQCPTVTRQGEALQRFSILSPSYSSSAKGLACDIVDPIFPFPATKIQSVEKALEWCYLQMERERSSPHVLLKYLINILKDPSEPKYRQIRTSNKRFWNGVWITAGRGVMHALGFEEKGAYVEIGPASGALSTERLKQISKAIHGLKGVQARMDGIDVKQQPEGADGYGRAGYGRIGMNQGSVKRVMNILLPKCNIHSTKFYHP